MPQAVHLADRLWNRPQVQDAEIDKELLAVPFVPDLEQGWHQAPIVSAGRP